MTDSPIKKIGAFGFFSFCILVIVIALTLFFLFVPQHWAFIRKLIRYFTGLDVRNVTIPEGYNRFQVAARLEAAGIVRAEDFLIITQEPSLLRESKIEEDTAEGYLFPDTYQFYVGTSPMVILKTMVKNFEKKFARLKNRYPYGLSYYRSLSINPRHAAVIVASMVEKEVSRQSEAPIVAGIFLKRLLDPTFSPHLLQSDPTVVYGCTALDPPPSSCRRFDGRLTREQLRDTENTYNTYIYAGLPPGPICNPGITALEAALNPAATQYYYFVARGDGTHHFSVTIEEHNLAVKKYRQDEETPPLEAP